MNSPAINRTCRSDGALGPFDDFILQTFRPYGTDHQKLNAGAYLRSSGRSDMFVVQEKQLRSKPQRGVMCLVQFLSTRISSVRLSSPYEALRQYIKNSCGIFEL